MSKNGHVRIQVLPEHIDGAVREHSGRCMVADAIATAIPGSRKRHVDMQTMRWTDEQGIRRTCLTPAAVQTALIRFDAGDSVQPFAFNMPRPIHINKPTKQVISGASRAKTEVTGNGPRPRIGGRPTPMMPQASSRRRFGIRNLRINQQGQVEQVGVIPTA